VNLRFSGAVALLFAYASAAAGAQQPAKPDAAAQACVLHLYPAEAVHSVGEDVDAVHRVDQDLRHYYETAGRPLDWLDPARQTALLKTLPLGELAGVPNSATTMHAEPLSRHQALEPTPHSDSSDCLIEVMLPQIMLERGGLATRSLRLFGVIRQYENGTLVRGYSGYAAAPMTGFQLRSPADAAAATQVVETAYVEAVKTLLQNSNKGHSGRQ
jgi:hypothetical protein